MDFISNAVGYIGVVIVLSVVYSLVKEIRVILKSNPDVQSKYGKNCWAVVTGGTDGIGKGFVEELYKQGVNIVIVARNVEKANQVVKELKSTHNNEVRIVEADFKNTLKDEKLFDRIHDAVKELDIGLIVNNHGMGQDEGDLLIAQDSSLIDLITVNCMSMALLTKSLLPLLLKRKTRSCIINLGSYVSTHPFAALQTYSATKAFDDHFSRIIAQELLSQIDVVSLRPLLVTTNMSKNKVNAFSIDRNQCALGCLNRLGLVTVTYGHWSHRLQGTIANLIPEEQLMQVMNWVSRYWSKK